MRLKQFLENRPEYLKYETTKMTIIRYNDDEVKFTMPTKDIFEYGNYELVTIGPCFRNGEHMLYVCVREKDV